MRNPLKPKQPSAAEQKQMNKRQTEREHREAIYGEFVKNIGLLGKEIHNKKVAGTTTIKYAKSRRWVPSSWGSLHFVVFTEESKALYQAHHQKDMWWTIAVTESGVMVSNFDLGNARVGPTGFRAVDLEKLQARDIHGDLWRKLEAAALRIKAELRYASSKKGS